MSIDLSYQKRHHSISFCTIPYHVVLRYAPYLFTSNLSWNVDNNYWPTCHCLYADLMPAISLYFTDIKMWKKKLSIKESNVATGCSVCLSHVFLASVMSPVSVDVKVRGRFGHTRTSMGIGTMQKYMLFFFFFLAGKSKCFPVSLSTSSTNLLYHD